MIDLVKERKTFAEIVATAKASPTPEREVCPGSFNRDGDLFDPDGNLIERVHEVTPEEARALVRGGALLAFEGCGCGGWAGCTPEWIAAEVRVKLGEAPTPRFARKYKAPTWIDLWEGGESRVVFAHGDVVWADALL